MEAIFCISSLLAGAGVALLAGGRRGPERPPEPPQREADPALAEDIALIRQWGNLLRYDGREQGESEE